MCPLHIVLLESFMGLGRVGICGIFIRTLALVCPLLRQGPFDSWVLGCTLCLDGVKCVVVWGCWTGVRARESHVPLALLS